MKNFKKVLKHFNQIYSQNKLQLFQHFQRENFIRQYFSFNSILIEEKNVFIQI